MTHKLTLRSLISLATLSTIAVSAAAADGQGEAARGYDRVLQHADKNGDGKLQVAELPPRLAARFANADANRDGVISRDEFAARKQALKKEHLAKVDANHDGKISPEERASARQSASKQRFSMMDKNGDGQVGPGDVGPNRWSRLAAADTDKNGSLSLTEFEQGITTGAIGHHGKH